MTPIQPTYNVAVLLSSYVAFWNLATDLKNFKSLFFFSVRKFENIYTGWGHKFDADNYTPPPPPAVMDEYPLVPEVTEVDDPTVEEERALKKAQEEAMEAAEDMDDVDDDEDDDD